MTRNQKVALAAVGTVVALYAISFFGSEGALVARFPTIDPKIVRKVHRKMYFEALSGKLENNVGTDEALDAIFLKKVDALTK